VRRTHRTVGRSEKKKEPAGISKKKGVSAGCRQGKQRYGLNRRRKRGHGVGPNGYVKGGLLGLKKGESAVRGAKRVWGIREGLGANS